VAPVDLLLTVGSPQRVQRPGFESCLVTYRRPDRRLGERPSGCIGSISASQLGEQAAGDRSLSSGPVPAAA